MITFQLILFVLAMAVTVVAFGATVWDSLKRPHLPKLNPQDSSRTLL